LTHCQDGRTIRELGPGGYLREISLIDGGPRTATVTASTPIDALVVDRDGFGRLMDDFPVVRLDLVSAITKRCSRQNSGRSTDACRGRRPSLSPPAVLR
jgi:CRP-like cAMP-binding protein